MHDWIYTKLNNWAKTKSTCPFGFDFYLDDNLKPHNILKIALSNIQAFLNTFRDAEMQNFGMSSQRERDTSAQSKGCIFIPVQFNY